MLLRARVYARACACGAGRAGWLDGADWWDGWLGWLVGCGVGSLLARGVSRLAGWSVLVVDTLP